MRKLFAFVAALVLAVSALGPMASTAAAADTTHLAGKPVTGIGFGPGSSCHATIYGRVNGSLSLFVPYHCWPNAGTVIYGPKGERIGVRGPNVAGITNLDTDMAWIDLDAGDHPSSNLHKVFVGSRSYYNYSALPPSTVACGSLSSNDALYSGYWYNTSSSQGPWVGNKTSVVNKPDGGCDVRTNIPTDIGLYWIPSGAPLWDATKSAFIGDAKSTVNGYTVYASWRDPMADLRAKYGTNDTYFCYTSGC